jgi:RHS repeat-associated protein
MTMLQATQNRFSFQAKKHFLAALRQGILSLLLVIGIFEQTLFHYSSYDSQGRLARTSSSGATQALTWDSFGRLIKVADKNSTWSATYDGLGRRIKTSSQGATFLHYYDPEVEYLELGHAALHESTSHSWWYGTMHKQSLSYSWNLYGPDRSGLYGGAQGIGGLEASSDQGNRIAINNFFGDTLGLMTSSLFTPYTAILGGYGPMPGSDEVNSNLEPQWRGRYQDETGLVYMGARYYEPNSGRFLSADPLGHNSSLSYSGCVPP